MKNPTRDTPSEFFDHKKHDPQSPHAPPPIPAKESEVITERTLRHDAPVVAPESIPVARPNEAPVHVSPGVRAIPGEEVHQPGAIPSPGVRHIPGTEIVVGGPTQQ